MRKTMCLIFLITIAITLASCSYDALTSMQISDLPWEELRLRHFVQYSIIISVISFPIGIYAIYGAIFPVKWTGEKIMKIKPKYFNYPFWVGVVGWIALMWLVVIRINNSIEFFNQSALPQETIEGIILLMILENIFLLVALILFGFGLSLWLYKQPAIREKGIIHGLLLLHWENISLAEWREPGTLKIHYRFTSEPSYLLFWERNQKQEEKERKLYLEVKPQQELEITEHLQNFIPNRVTGR